MSQDKDKDGWVYCISNENVRSAKLPNNILLKIGMTERTPHERLAEANKSDTWRPPLNYKIEFAKKVKNALQKEKTIYKLLEQYNERVNRSREFFDISVEKARLYFDLMDGEYLELKESEDPKPLEPKIKKVQRGGQKKKEIKNNVEPIENNIEINNIMTEKAVDGFQAILNANIKDLGEQESKKILTTAFDKSSLDIKVDKTYYTFDKISKISSKQIKNKVFRAIISSPTQPDMYITTKNIESVINQIKYKTDSSFILLDELCKM
jgi:hypothetical protein